MNDEDEIPFDFACGWCGAKNSHNGTSSGLLCDRCFKDRMKYSYGEAIVELRRLKAELKNLEVKKHPSSRRKLRFYAASIFGGRGTPIVKAASLREARKKFEKMGKVLRVYLYVHGDIISLK